MSEEKVSNEEQNNDVNTCFLSNNVSVGFQCRICHCIQKFEIPYLQASEVFPICNECLKDLKEFVLSKRERNKEDKQ